jgi:hypothetical protein
MTQQKTPIILNGYIYPELDPFEKALNEYNSIEIDKADFAKYNFIYNGKSFILETEARLAIKQQYITLRDKIQRRGYEFDVSCDSQFVNWEDYDDGSLADADAFWSWLFETFEKRAAEVEIESIELTRQPYTSGYACYLTLKDTYENLYEEFLETLNSRP